MAIAADPARSRALKVAFSVLLILGFVASGAVDLWRHHADAPPAVGKKPRSPPAAASLVPVPTSPPAGAPHSTLSKTAAHAARGAKKPARREFGAKIVSTSAQAARIIITKFEMVPSNDGYRNVRLYMKNVGAGVGYAPMATSTGFAVLDEFSAGQIDDFMDRNTRSAREKPPRAVQQVEPGEEFWITLPWSVAPNEFADIQTGKKAAFLFVTLGYRDDTMQEGHYWMHEFCGEQRGDLTSIRICAQRTFLN